MNIIPSRYKLFKRSLFFALYYSGITSALVRCYGKLKQHHPCVVLLYHRFVDDDTYFLYKSSVVQHHISAFVKEVSFLNRHFLILSMDDLVVRMKTGSGFQKPSVVFTFDDGYLDNYALAYPILVRFSVPATIYLTTSLIGTSDRTWTDLIELGLLKSSKQTFRLPQLFGEEDLSIKSVTDKERTNIRVAEALKSVADAERVRILEVFFRAIAVGPADLQDDSPRMMLDWSEIQTMARNGVTFGAHSHTHPILSKMPVQNAKSEILLSKKIIENNLHIQVEHFAFPNGREVDFSAELRDYCREIGFQSIASCVYGLNGASDNVMALKRIGAKSPVWVMAGDLLLRFARWYGRSNY